MLFTGLVVCRLTRVNTILCFCFTTNMKMIYNVKVIAALVLGHIRVELTMYGSKEAADMQAIGST